MSAWDGLNSEQREHVKYLREQAAKGLICHCGWFDKTGVNNSNPRYGDDCGGWQKWVFNPALSKNEPVGDKLPCNARIVQL
jgi:hypothetical protein